MLFFCHFIYVEAQTIERSVLASAGSSYTNSNYSIDWTMGESTVNTGSSGTYSVTQGFHQFYFKTGGKEETSIIKGLKYYPNPTSNSIILEFTHSSETALINIYDLNGKLLLNQDWNTFKCISIDLSTYPCGIYYFQLILDGKSNGIKITKM